MSYDTCTKDDKRAPHATIRSPFHRPSGYDICAGSSLRHTPPPRTPNTTAPPTSLRASDSGSSVPLASHHQLPQSGEGERTIHPLTLESPMGTAQGRTTRREHTNGQVHPPRRSSERRQLQPSHQLRDPGPHRGRRVRLPRRRVRLQQPLPKHRLQGRLLRLLVQPPLPLLLSQTAPPLHILEATQENMERGLSDSEHLSAHTSPQPLYQRTGWSTLGRTPLHISHPSGYFHITRHPVVFSYQPKQGEDFTSHTNVSHHLHERRKRTTPCHDSFAAPPP